MDNAPHGLIDNWLRHLKDIYQKHGVELEAIADYERRVQRFCELNVIEQVLNVCSTTIVQDAWQRGQALAVHGWVYDLRDGLLRDLKICVTNPEEVPAIYRLAVAGQA
jgi:carbonic anhydrase